MRLTTIATSLVLTTASLTMLSTTSTTASAAASCKHVTCDDKGPVSQDCATTSSEIAAVRVYVNSIPMRVQLMASSGCHSAYARGASGRSGSQAIPATYDIRVQRRNTASGNITGSIVTSVPPDENWWDWTNMLGRTTPSQVRACGRPTDGRVGAWKCTAWYSHSH